MGIQKSVNPAYLFVCSIACFGLPAAILESTVRKGVSDAVRRSNKHFFEATLLSSFVFPALREWFDNPVCRSRRLETVYDKLFCFNYAA